MFRFKIFNIADMNFCLSIVVEYVKRCIQIVLNFQSAWKFK